MVFFLFKCRMRWVKRLMACSTSGKFIDRLSIFIDKQLYWIPNLRHWPCKCWDAKANAHTPTLAQPLNSNSLPLFRSRFFSGVVQPRHKWRKMNNKIRVNSTNIANGVSCSYHQLNLFACLLAGSLAVLCRYTQCIHNKITHAFHTWPPMVIRFCNALHLLINVALATIASMTHGGLDGNDLFAFSPFGYDYFMPLILHDANVLFAVCSKISNFISGSSYSIGIKSISSSKM